MDTTGTGPVAVSWCDGDVAAVVAIATATVPVAVRPLPTEVVLVLAWLVVVPAFEVAGVTVTLSRPAVVAVVLVAPIAVVPTVAVVVVVAVVDCTAALLDGEPLTATGPFADAEDSSDATTDGDTCSVSSGGLGGGVAKPDQQVDGELLLDVTLLAQSKPTSTSTRVDHVVSQGDSERGDDDDAIGSSFR